MQAVSKQLDPFMCEGHMNNHNYHVNPYFAGKKVKVDIPLSTTKIFSEWALINETEENLVSVQLSRDVLPDGAILRVGQALTIHSEHDCQLHSSRCFIVSMGLEQQLLLRLSSGSFAGEMREYYRVDAFLPLKHQSLNDQNPDNVRKMWEEKRKWRQEDIRGRETRRLEAKRIRIQEEERIRALHLLSGSPAIEQGENSRDEEQEAPQFNQYADLLTTAKATAVTISGGGIKISTNQRFDPDELIMLEIFVPSARIIVDIVARVVFASRDHVSDEGPDRFNIGMQFVFIDEAGRQAINTHIGSIQLKQIRHFKGFSNVKPFRGEKASEPDQHYAYIAEVDGGGYTDAHPQNSTLKSVALGLFAICIFCLVGFAFHGYLVTHPKSEIQKIIERAFHPKEPEKAEQDD